MSIVRDEVYDLRVNVYVLRCVVIFRWTKISSPANIWEGLHVATLAFLYDGRGGAIYAAYAVRNDDYNVFRCNR